MYGFEIDTHIVTLQMDTNYRTLLAHELLHIMARQLHSENYLSDDNFVIDDNLFSIGRRITTESYLSAFDYNVSPEFKNQEEKIRDSSLLKQWED